MFSLVGNRHSPLRTDHRISKTTSFPPPSPLKSRKRLSLLSILFSCGIIFQTHRRSPLKIGASGIGGVQILFDLAWPCICPVAFFRTSKSFHVLTIFSPRSAFTALFRQVYSLPFFPFYLSAYDSRPLFLATTPFCIPPTPDTRKG